MSTELKCAQHRLTRRLWSLDIDAVTMHDATQVIRSWIEHPGPTCKLVATPNVDHVVQVFRRRELSRIFEASSLTIADGWPIVTMSRFYGPKLPERVPGSDLLPRLCEDFSSRDSKLRIFLLGGRAGVPERAAKAISAKWPSAQVVGVASPELGFEADETTNRQLREQINASQADVLVVGLGFPKQEHWILKHKEHLRVPVALALGGTIDFLAGEQRRAPHWIQNLRLEWLHRLATNPRRLAKRYALDAILFPWVCAIHWFHNKASSQ